MGVCFQFFRCLRYNYNVQDFRDIDKLPINRPSGRYVNNSYQAFLRLFLREVAPWLASLLGGAFRKCTWQTGTGTGAWLLLVLGP